MSAAAISCKDETPGTGPEPSIELLSAPEIPWNAAGGEITYKINNPIEGEKVSASSEDGWASGFVEKEPGTISFSVTPNEESEARTATVTLSYAQAEDISVEITQLGKEEEVSDDKIRLEVTDVETFSAKVKAVPADEDMTYLLLTREKSDFESLGEDEDIIAADLDMFAKYAEKEGVSLELFLEAVMLRKGVTEGTMDTFLPNTSYYIYTYGIDKFQKVTTEVYRKLITTLPVTQYDDRIEIKATGIEARSIAAEFIPESDEFRYFTGYMTSAEYDQYGDGIVDYMLNELELIIQMNNALGTPTTWDDLTLKGKQSTLAKSLYSGIGYCFFAFGIDNGYKNTGLFSERFTTLDDEITDNCTFDVSLTSVGTFDASVKYVPSSAQTKYFTTYLESASIEGLSDSQIADACLNAADEAGVNWETTDLLRTGTATEELKELVPVTEYSIIVFGVNGNGDRTTEVSITRFTTKEVEPSDMTLSISVNKTTYSDVTVSVLSSSQSEQYALTIVPVSDYELLGNDPDKLVSTICSDPSSYYTEILSGNQTKTLSYTWKNQFIAPGTQYIAVAFGTSYWHPTTKAFMTALATPARDVSDATVDIKLTVFEGNDLVEYDPVKYPESKWKDRAAIKIEFLPNASTATWYGWLETRNADYMKELNYDVLLQAIKKFGQHFDNPAPGSALVQTPWNYENYSAISLGVDSDGKDGAPVIVSLCVDRSQAVPFDPEALKGCRETRPLTSNIMMPYSTHAAAMTETGSAAPQRRTLPQHILEEVSRPAEVPVRSLEEIAGENISAIMERTTKGNNLQ